MYGVTDARSPWSRAATPRFVPSSMTLTSGCAARTQLLVSSREALSTRIVVTGTSAYRRIEPNRRSSSLRTECATTTIVTVASADSPEGVDRSIRHPLE